MIYRTGHFQIEKNHLDFIAIGGTSAEHDRYLKPLMLHTSLKFRLNRLDLRMSMGSLCRFLMEMMLWHIQMNIRVITLKKFLPLKVGE